MASLTDIWAQLQQAGKPPPYLLIDCAGVDGGQARLPVQAFDQIECLFTGDLAVELADVGPYLARLKSFAPEVTAAVGDLLVRHTGLLVVLQDPPEGQPDIPFAQLHRHFRKFNVTYGPNGNPLFFRYYDPRVLVDVLSVLEAKQLDAFFGPVETLVLIDSTNQPVRCQRQAGSLAVLA